MNKFGDRNQIAKVVIPLAIGAWLIGGLVMRPGVPGWAVGLFTVCFVAAVLGTLFYFFTHGSWAELAKRYPVKQPFSGTWAACPTLHVSSVSWNDPDYNRTKMRFVGIMRFGMTEQDLHAHTIFSSVPGLSLMFPAAQIPWSAIKSAQMNQQSGMVQAPRSPGTLFQATYDPGFSGEVVELAVGEPPIFMQFKSDVLGASVAKLPLS